MRDPMMALPFHISDGDFVLLPCYDGCWNPLYMTLKPSRSAGGDSLGGWFLVESGQTWRSRGDWDQLGVLLIKEDKMYKDKCIIYSLLIKRAQKKKKKNHTQGLICCFVLLIASKNFIFLLFCFFHFCRGKDQILETILFGFTTLWFD